MVQAARFQGWLRRADSALLGGSGEKAGEDLSERISGWGLPPGVHSGDREKHIQGGGKGKEYSAGQGLCWGRGAGPRSCGSCSRIMAQSHLCVGKIFQQVLWRMHRRGQAGDRAIG